MCTAVQYAGTVVTFWALMGVACVAPRPMVRCTSNLGCPANQFCRTPDGQCDAEGVCEARPEVCTEEFAPVCGCDGRTYPNACHAAREGVSVDHEGECATGAACTTNEDCPAAQYCDKPDGDCDGPGVCAPIPEVCTMEYAPVCGCDGQTYPNACHAAAAGENVDFVGECQ